MYLRQVLLVASGVALGAALPQNGSAQNNSLSKYPSYVPTGGPMFLMSDDSE
jgi:hypothetical protein